MRRVGLYLIIGIIFFSISYLLLQELSPFNPQKLEELIEEKEIEDGDFEMLDEEINNLINRGLIWPYLSDNAYVVFFCILAGIFCSLTAIHLVIDKIFFKNFYEGASHFDAVRRAFLVVATIALFLFAKLNRSETYVLILVIVVPILIEVVFKLYFKKRDEVEKEGEGEGERESREIKGKHISYEDALNDLGGFKR